MVSVNDIIQRLKQHKPQKHWDANKRQQYIYDCVAVGEAALKDDPDFNLEKYLTECGIETTSGNSGTYAAGRWREVNPARARVHTKKWDECVRDVKRKGEAVDPYAVCTASLGYRASIKAGHRRKNPSHGWLIVALKRGKTEAYYDGSGFNTVKSSAKIYRSATAARQAGMRLYPQLKTGYALGIVALPATNPAPSRDNLAQAEKLYKGFHGDEPNRERQDTLPQFEAGLDVGKLHAVEYDTVRDGERIRFRHTFKKRARPSLVSSADGRNLALTGGAFRFTDRGIVDDA